jgi:tetratricopeptide (TPR) repeat protein
MIRETAPRREDNCKVRNLTKPVDVDRDEVARFERVVAESDARGGPDDRWRAAHGVFAMAELLEPLEGADAVIPLYEEVVERLEGAVEPGPRDLYIAAMGNLVAILHEQGRDEESRSLAETLVAEHFDDPPPRSLEAVLNAAFQLAELLGLAGELEPALALLERVRGANPPDGLLRRRTAAGADSTSAWIHIMAGRPDEALRLYREVIAELGDPGEPALRWSLARAMVGEAHALDRTGRFADRDAVCRAVVDRFHADEDPAIAVHVESARALLGGSRRWWRKKH